MVSHLWSWSFNCLLLFCREVASSAVYSPTCTCRCEEQGFYCLLSEYYHETQIEINKLGPGPPELWVTSGQKPRTKIIYIVLINFCTTFWNTFFRKKLLLATPNVENKCWISYETLKSTGEMKMVMKFCLCLHKFSELWNLFSLIPMGSCFRCYIRQFNI